MQALTGFIWRKWQRALRQQRTRVQPFVQEHDGGAALAVARLDGRLNRRRPPPARQQRRVYIDRAIAGQLQKRWRKDLPIGGDHMQVRSPGTQRLNCRLVADAMWLNQREASFTRERFHGRLSQALAAARPAIGLGNHAYNLMRDHQGVQAWQSEGRRTHEDYLCHSASHGEMVVSNRYSMGISGHSL